MSKASDAAEAKADAATAKIEAKSAAELKASLPLLAARMVEVLARHGTDKELHAQLVESIALNSPPETVANASKTE